MEQVWHALPKTHTAIVAPPPRISVFHPLCCVESTMCASLTMLKHLFEPLTLRTSAEVKDVTALYNTLGEELITGGVSVTVKLWKQIHLSGQYVLFFPNCCWDWVFLGEKWTCCDELPWLYHLVVIFTVSFNLMPWVCCNDQKASIWNDVLMFLCCAWRAVEALLVRGLSASFFLMPYTWWPLCKIDSTHNMSIFNLQGFIFDGLDSTLHPGVASDNWVALLRVSWA